MLTATFSVECHIKKCQADKKFGFIYVIITIDRELAEVSTKNKVLVKDWNYSQKRVNGRGIEAKSINENLDLIKSQIKQKYRDLQHEPNVITAASVKSSYLGVQRKLKGKKMEDLLSDYKKYREPKLKYGHFKNINTTVRYVERFIDEKFAGMYLSQLDTEMMTKFEMFVRDNPIKPNSPCKGNGLGKHLERFKRII
ncbi:phage integrase SAM-like domain and Arm DNA-binding domain-containing protein [Terrimonas sp. NA20]|uniref:Phage integrase SAM-like domain and Arm DNA-binding domain-containing protein n=1 Tax=Terrimonas ginsenosidimutans TaxID=2908004 RepID=A0ABS9KSG4_9BACT|nr:phage integrase SAM-like domain-containing protein [Terrimonas ginsenosidimutans]MCG2615267.1 phage integrase SAM-like domain and Arm DNA-binding domain-containing protein [Terrimonas ginsenosidimutans]